MIEECLVVEFRVTGDGCPLADATRETGIAVDAQPPQRRSDGTALLRFSGDDDGSLAAALDADERIRYLHGATAGDRTNFRCVSLEQCVVGRLVDAGFLAESLVYDGGTERYTGAVVGRDVLTDLLEAAGEAVGVTIERIYPLGGEDETTIADRWDLTPAQEEALRAAYRMGYFSVPRETTATEVAAEIGVSKSAFLERLKRAQGRTFRGLFGPDGD